MEVYWRSDEGEIAQTVTLAACLAVSRIVYINLGVLSAHTHNGLSRWLAASLLYSHRNGISTAMETFKL